MDAHPLDVRCDRAVDEREARAARVLLPEHVERVLVLPEVEDTMIDLGKIELSGDRPEPCSLACLRHILDLLSDNKNAVPVSGRRAPWYHPS